MSGNQVEFFAQIRQRRLCIDSRDDAANAKKIGRAAEERFVVRIEPQAFVAEHPAEVEEVTGAAAKIQDVERRRAIKPEVLHALHVDANPVVRVLVGIDLSCVWAVRILFAQLYQLSLIDRAQNPSTAYRMGPTAGVFPQAFRRISSEELLKFLRKSHGETMQ